MEATVVVFMSNQSAGFDRIRLALTNIVAQAFGMKHEACNSRSATIGSTKTYIRAGLGVLKGSYANTEGAPKIAGEIQGRGTVGRLITMSCGTLLDADGSIYTGLDLPVITGTNSVQKNNDAYGDDVDTCVGSMENGPLEANNVMVHLTDGSPKWTNFPDVVAQSTAFHKCTAQILSYIQVKSSLKIDYDTQHILTLIELKGA